jgi:DNA-binding NtrC family response regulator
MKKILLLDDNDDYLEILELVLGKKYTVRSSTDLKELPQILNEFDPDLILIDHFLGLHTSAYILDHLHSTDRSRSMPFILFSGVHEIEKRAEEIGAAGFISKPSSIDHIRKYIDDFFKYRFK